MAQIHTTAENQKPVEKKPSAEKSEEPKISIKRISNKVGPTAPGFDPSSVMHSPNNST